MRNDLLPMARYLYDQGVKDMVEIGSFRGCSAKAFASVGIKVLCVDPYVSDYDKGDGSSNAEKLKSAYEHFTLHVLDNKTIFHIKKNSLDACRDFIDTSLSFVYIDGNHRYDHVKNDILNWKAKIKHGGFIGGHDWTRVDPNSKKLEVNNAVLDTLGDPILFGTNWLFRIQHEV
jgi:predicted O-methyltransferase YrrM